MGTFLIAVAAFCIGNYFGRKDATDQHCSCCKELD